MCCFSHSPEDFFRGMFSMQMTKTAGPFVVFVKKKKQQKNPKHCVNLKRVLNSSDLYMSSGI